MTAKREPEGFVVRFPDDIRNVDLQRALAVLGLTLDPHAERIRGRREVLYRAVPDSRKPARTCHVCGEFGRDTPAIVLDSGTPLCVAHWREYRESCDEASQ